VFSALQELCHITDEEVDSVPEVYRHLTLMANMVCFYQAEGVKKLDDALRKAALEAMGVSVIIPKPSK
jgi:hypothetical protein